MWTRQLVRQVQAQFRCDWQGWHGFHHWCNVARNGRAIADELHAMRELVADDQVVSLFALFHDAGRHDEHADHGHGKRGADLAHRLWKQGEFDISPRQMEVLHYACAYHSDGLTSTDPTIGVCWDADRLDLRRLRITVDIKLLSYRTLGYSYYGAMTHSSRLKRRILSRT